MAETKKLEETVTLKEGVSASLEGTILVVKGPNGETRKDFATDNISLKAESGKVTITSVRDSKRERKIVGSFKAHITNMMVGVIDGHKVMMKVLSGHFPMTVTVTGNQFTVKNFLGEKTLKKITIPDGVSVKVKGQEVEIGGVDKETVGNTASRIENSTRRTKFDRRIFQDGIVRLIEAK